MVGVLGVFTCPSEDSEEEEEDSLVSCWTREEPSVVVLSMLLNSTMLRLRREENMPVRDEKQPQLKTC